MKIDYSLSSRHEMSWRENLEEVEVKDIDRRIILLSNSLFSWKIDLSGYWRPKSLWKSTLTFILFPSFLYIHSSYNLEDFLCLSMIHYPSRDHVLHECKIERYIDERYERYILLSYIHTSNQHFFHLYKNDE